MYNMLLTTTILGWIGIIMFLGIMLSYRWITRNNEFALLHILLAFMFAMWLPLPFTLVHILNVEYLRIGAIFGTVYLLMLVVTMTLQAGHIAFIEKTNDGKEIPAVQGQYMMSTLSDPFEGLANILKCIWGLLLALAFWQESERILAVSMFLFCLFIFYYLAITINTVLVKQVKLFSQVKANIYLTNLETFLFFLVLVIFITVMP